MNDRIRSKPPKNDPESWSYGAIKSVRNTSSGVEIKVISGNDEALLSITDSIYELFTSRLESDSEKGEEIWYKEKN